MSTLIQIVLVAMLGVFGNIAYFEYQQHKKSSKEILKERLTNLLLPIYFILKEDELTFNWMMNNDDGLAYEAEKPQRLFKELKEIIRKNIYLADDELHNACLDFLNWAYESNTDDRFQELNIKGLKEEKQFDKFYKIVIKKYKAARKEYLE